MFQCELTPVRIAADGNNCGREKLARHKPSTHRERVGFFLQVAELAAVAKRLPAMTALFKNSGDFRYDQAGPSVSYRTASGIGNKIMTGSPNRLRPGWGSDRSLNRNQTRKLCRILPCCGIFWIICVRCYNAAPLGFTLRKRRENAKQSQTGKHFTSSQQQLPGQPV